MRYDTLDACPSIFRTALLKAKTDHVARVACQILEQVLGRGRAGPRSTVLYYTQGLRRQVLGMVIHLNTCTWAQPYGWKYAIGTRQLDKIDKRTQIGIVKGIRGIEAQRSGALLKRMLCNCLCISEDDDVKSAQQKGIAGDLSCMLLPCYAVPWW